jgi:hypothetical protein
MAKRPSTETLIIPSFLPAYRTTKRCVMRTTLTILCLAMLIVGSAAHLNADPQQSLPVSINTKVYKACGLVIGEKAVGSGFWVDYNTFVTCLHVVADAGDSLKVETVDGKVYHVTSVLNYSLNDDVIVLQLAPSNTVWLDLMDDPTIGTKIWSVGNSEGAEVLKVDDGTVTALGVGILEMTAQIRPGCSGGPIVDSEGRVLGMTAFFRFPMISLGEKGYVRDTSLDTARKFAISSSRIHRYTTGSQTNSMSIGRIQSLNAERQLARLFFFIDDQVAQLIYKALCTKLTFQDDQKRTPEQSGIFNGPYGQVTRYYTPSQIVQDGYLCGAKAPCIAFVFTDVSLRSCFGRKSSA